MQKYQYRYKLHQYLRYARQWVVSLAYRGNMYTLNDDGKIIKGKQFNNEENQTI